MNSSLSRLRLCCIAVAWLLLPLVARAQVLEVRLTGLEGELEKNALAWLGDPPTTPQARANYLYTVEEKLTGSLQALGYYRPEITLDLERSEPSWVLDIHVDPGEPVHLRKVEVRVTGAAEEDPAFRALLDDTGLHSGDVLNHQAYENLRRRIDALGKRRGYFDGQFTRSRVEVEPIAGVADVYLDYSSGERYRFGSVTYDHAQIDDKLLAQLLTFSPGEPYDQDRLRDSQVQLQRTGWFSTVILRPDPDAAKGGEVPVDLDLFPAMRHTFDVGVGYSTDTEERFTLTWRTPHLNRKGHSQEIRYRYSAVNPSGSFIYSIPMTHPLNDVLQLGVRVEENEFGDLDSRQIEFGVRREFKQRNWVYSYSLRNLDEEWQAIGQKRESQYLLPGFTFSQRLRGGSLVNPTSGFSQWYRIEGGLNGVGSDMNLLRATAKYGYIQSFGERQRMVLRSDLGAVFMSGGNREDLAPSLNFFAGGGQSLRGWGYQSIGRKITTTNDKGEEVKLVVGGERLATASAEYQYSFTPKWRGALFMDGGDAFDQGDFHLNYAAGFGIHYITQVGAVRVEMAYPISDHHPDWRLHLAIGAEF